MHVYHRPELDPLLRHEVKLLNMSVDSKITEHIDKMATTGTFEKRDKFADAAFWFEPTLKQLISFFFEPGVTTTAQLYEWLAYIFVSRKRSLR